MQVRNSLWISGLAGILALPAVPFLIGADSSTPQRLRIDPAPIATDKSVKYDYDIVYVRAPRKDGVRRRWAEIATPHVMDPGADLMLLHPDGNEELLVAGGADGSVTDPVRLLRRRVGLLRALPRPETGQSARSLAPGCGHLQDPRQDAQDRPPDAAEFHAEHRRGQLVERLPHAGSQGKTSLRLRRLQHGARARCPAARSSSPATATPSARRSDPRRIHRSAAVRHGRRRQQRRAGSAI